MTRLLSIQVNNSQVNTLLSCDYRLLTIQANNSQKHAKQKQAENFIDGILNTDNQGPSFLSPPPCFF